ncbi:MAG: carbamate kinase [Rhodospirillales bacterium]|nr:carbamate kinase [Rhodospirillales bacterium]MCW9040828.1 carbamate kinase [Rhodospirillales bacterium]
MLVVVALGGNAILQRDELPEAAVQRRNIEVAAHSIAEMARAHTIVVTHGNGPQVGLLAIQAAALDALSPYPLDVLGAESEGMIGYVLEQELRNVLPGRNIATLLTQVRVDLDDPAFAHPTKPIGPFYDAARATEIGRERGWTMAQDGDSWRRVVASPYPREILEINTIQLLVLSETVVICSGGGGIPVAVGDDGAINGVEAVVDKDLSAALLAVKLNADALVLLTDVHGVWTGWNTPEARLVRRASPDMMRRHDFAEGSMGPKVAAACAFVEATRGVAGIGKLTSAMAILEGREGTRITPGRNEFEEYDAKEYAP